MGTSVKERLKMWLKSEGLNANAFCSSIGVSSGYISGMRESIQPDKLKSIAIQYHSLDLGWLLTGEGEMYKSEVQIIHQPKINEPLTNEETIVYDIDAAANLKTLLADKTANILGKISIPNVPKCDGALYVRGDSMYPLLKSGDLVGYKEIPLDMRYIHFGEMYLVSIDEAGEEYLTVKYVKSSDKGEDWVLLVSYNSHHSPKDVHISTVRAMALVKFSIRINSMR